MLRALSVEEVAFVSGGMMEDADSFDDDSGGGGGDGGDSGGDGGGMSDGGGDSDGGSTYAPVSASNTSSQAQQQSNGAKDALCDAGGALVGFVDGVLVTFAATPLTGPAAPFLGGAHGVVVGALTASACKGN